MNLQDYIVGLTKFAEENPETLLMQVVTSKDDEGNEFNPIYYAPSKGIFEDSEFLSIDQYRDWDREESETNAVCVN